MNNSIEEIIRLDDGRRVKLRCELTTDRAKYKYLIYATVAGKGKRIFKPLIDPDDYEYRGLSLENRALARSNAIADLVGLAPCISIADKLYAKFSPEKLGVDAG